MESSLLSHRRARLADARFAGLNGVRNAAHAALERCAGSTLRNQMRWDKKAAAATQAEPAAPIRSTDCRDGYDYGSQRGTQRKP